MSQKTAAEILALSRDVVNAEKTTNEEIFKIYDKWAGEYEQDMAVKGVDYVAPKWLAENVSRILSDQKDARILDVGTGPGLAGVLLKNDGFTNIDALDGSVGMLEKAASRNVYKKLIHVIIGPKPLDIEDSVYDAVIAIGALCQNHIPASCFNEFVRITKPGGCCILGIWELAMRGNKPEMDRLISEGKWNIKEKITTDQIFQDEVVHLFTFEITK